MAEDTKKAPETDEKDSAKKEVLDPKYLKGLVYRSSEPKDVEEDGRKKKKYLPKERPLRIEDVLSWKDCGKHVVIVTADGRKYQVEKQK